MVFCNECGVCVDERDNFCYKCGHILKKRGILDKNVDCSPYIHHSDIAKFRYDNHDRLSDVDRRLFQEAMTLVTEENQWVWRNARLILYGELGTVVFYSGDRTNMFVVQLNSEDDPTHAVEEKGWRLWFRDAFKTGWGWIKSAAGAVAGSLTGGLAKLAIGWLS